MVKYILGFAYGVIALFLVSIISYNLDIFDYNSESKSKLQILALKFYTIKYIAQLMA